MAHSIVYLLAWKIMDRTMLHITAHVMCGLLVTIKESSIVRITLTAKAGNKRSGV